MEKLDPLTLSRIVSFLQERIDGLLSIYIFGSAARGEMRVDSDLDIGFLCEAGRAKTSKMDLWNMRMELEELVKRSVDLIDCADADPILRANVMLKGQLIFSSDEVRSLEAEILSQRLREDFEIAMRPILEEVFRTGQATRPTKLLPPEDSPFGSRPQS
jgi:predicted nucleotidyltransferase